MSSFVVVELEQKISEVILFLMFFSVSFLCRYVRSSDFDALNLFSFLELFLTVFMLPQFESLVADLLCCASFCGRKIDSPDSFCIFWCHHHSLILLETSLKTIFPKNISDVITRLCFRCSLRFYCIEDILIDFPHVSFSNCDI